MNLGWEIGESVFVLASSVGTNENRPREWNGPVDGFGWDEIEL
jgi:hypothetical protein